MSEISREQIEDYRIANYHKDKRVDPLCDLALKGLSAEQPAKPVAEISVSVTIKSLVQLLESVAPNTDTCWQWQAASSLRKCQTWETSNLPPLLGVLQSLPSADTRPSERRAAQLDYWNVAWSRGSFVSCVDRRKPTER